MKVVNIETEASEQFYRIKILKSEKTNSGYDERYFFPVPIMDYS